MRKNIVFFIVFILLAGGIYFLTKDAKNENADKIAENPNFADETSVAGKRGFGAGEKMTVYKSQNCGCCVGYVAALEENGFDVEVNIVDDMSAIKSKYKIPADKQSCHTVIFGDYFIEGHVPMEAIEKLMREKPEIDGIGLPRMPAGTPGMSGQKREPYEVYQSVDGEFSEFLTI